MIKYFALSTALLFALEGCTTNAQSNPPRTATEELLISTAAEHAAAKLTLPMPAQSAVFVDNSNFEGTDSKNAIAAIRTVLLQHGAKLVDDKKKADVIIETRAGALSIDRSTFLIGIPQFNIPVPFASTPVTFPEIALYGTEEQEGVAKFAVTGYDAKKGTLVATQEPQYGFSHKTNKTAFFFISWTDTDAIPDEDDVQGDTGNTAEAQKETPNPAPQP
jgi:hypothetical protein